MRKLQIPKTFIDSFHLIHEHLFLFEKSFIYSKNTCKIDILIQKSINNNIRNILQILK